MATETDSEEREETHGEKPAEKGGKPGDKPIIPDKKKEQKKQTIIAAAAVIGLILAWLTFRKGGSGAAATAPAAGGSIGAYTPSGAVAGSGFDSSAFQGLQTLLSNQGQALQGLESAVANLTPTASTSDTAAVTPHPLAAWDWNAPAVTGDINQDTALEESPYVAGLYAQYKANPTQGTQQNYLTGFYTFIAQRGAGKVDSGSLQQTTAAPVPPHS